MGSPARAQETKEDCLNGIQNEDQENRKVYESGSRVFSKIGIENPLISSIAETNKLAGRLFYNLSDSPLFPKNTAFFWDALVFCSATLK